MFVFKKVRERDLTIIVMFFRRWAIQCKALTAVQIRPYLYRSYDRSYTNTPCPDPTTNQLNESAGMPVIDRSAHSRGKKSQSSTVPKKQRRVLSKQGKEARLGIRHRLMGSKRQPKHS